MHGVERGKSPRRKSEAYLSLFGIVPDFKKKLATARSRNIGMSILYQNVPQLQNRYPDGQWEEILGGCDISMFLGCNDMTTATYFSDRSGEVTVGVSSIRKNLTTVRMSNYVPDYSETSSVGKRMLLLPDEVLRFPLDQALVIIRGQKILRIRKMDYTRHSEAAKFIPEKTDCHIPEWRRWEDAETERKAERDDVFDLEDGFEPGEWPGADKAGDEMEPAGEPTEENAGEPAKEADLKTGTGVFTEPERLSGREPGKIEKVEDLFTDDW